MWRSLLILAPAFVACATADDVDGVVGTSDHPQRVSIASDESTSALHATLRDADGVHAGDSDVTVRGGEVVLHREPEPEGGARIVVDELRIAYADVVLPPAYFHDGQVLTGLALRLERPVGLDAQSRATVELELDWSLRVNGIVSPLASQTLADFQLDVQVGDDPGGLRVDLFALRPDVMWLWADVITLGDAFVHVTAYPSID